MASWFFTLPVTNILASSSPFYIIFKRDLLKNKIDSHAVRPIQYGFYVAEIIDQVTGDIFLTAKTDYVRRQRQRMSCQGWLSSGDTLLIYWQKIKHLYNHGVEKTDKVFPEFTQRFNPRPCEGPT